MLSFVAGTKREKKQPLVDTNELIAGLKPMADCNKTNRAQMGKAVK